MNTNELKRFAQDIRRKLMQQVTAKLDFVLNSDTPELRERAEQVKKLKEELKKTSREQLIDKVAYTWFNRLIALRFMDANDYQPLGVRVISPLPNQTSPELLNQAKQGDIPSELKVNVQNVMDILDGRTTSSNPQNEVFKTLLIGACNHLSSVLPFLFERINDYTELLLPDDLTSEFSVVSDIVKEMSEEDCKEVEIIGWLYQFYISELNDELISSKKKYEKDELAPASQLFTPKWIVQYMVDNTLGQVWSEINPNTKITDSLEFYMKPAYLEQLEKRETKSIEEIKFFEPCVGSGHILSYAFDVFYKIYEEQGYNPSEIPELIITKNLFGIDIDPRAAQLASFVLIMKGREKHRRFLSTVEKKQIQPNISFYQDFEFDEKFKNATALGSLIRVEESDIKKLKVDKKSLFGERQNEVKKLYELLGQRYDVVVTNPPYINSSRMEDSLKLYVNATYPETKSDLFATFILRCLELCNEDGLTGYMTPFVWMFISSYEKLREVIIDKHFINNLIQLEYSGFDGATVPICTFTLRNKLIIDGLGSYIRLSDFKGSENQSPKTLEAIRNPNCEWYYTANQNDFKKIKSSPVAYDCSTSLFKIFEEADLIEDLGSPRKGMVTANNLRFIRFWFEISNENYSIDSLSRVQSKKSGKKWFPYAKGGSFRRWFGNNENVINWFNDGEGLLNLKSEGYKVGSTNHNFEFIFKEAIVWSKITSDKQSFRFVNNGSLYDDASGLCSIKDSKNTKYILAVLNSKIIHKAFKYINPTLNLQPGNVASVPIILANTEKSNLISDLVTENINISTLDWNSKEISNHFKKSGLINTKFFSIEESYDLYQQFWKTKLFQLHKNEENLNRQIIDIYGLNDELTPYISLKDITILKEETSIEEGQLIFDAKEVFSQFLSYSVGCMFGRYSLDKEGLILANQVETLKDYLEKLALSEDKLSFTPDDDNIIPILDDEWFEDDIVGRFNDFLKASFGEDNFHKNLAFVEEQIGDIRKYFVKTFYNDHIKRYKKRPIYWMFSSPKGHFNVMVYMHRYTPDTIHNILNNYLREFIEKLKSRKEHLAQIQVSGSATEQTKAIKEIDNLDKMLFDCQEYEREILYKLATERIEIDLDDGVLVNYNKFGKALKEVKGLNDKKAKDKVKKFDWIDVKEIR